MAKFSQNEMRSAKYGEKTHNAKHKSQAQVSSSKSKEQGTFIIYSADNPTFLHQPPKDIHPLTNPTIAQTANGYFRTDKHHPSTIRTRYRARIDIGPLYFRVWTTTYWNLHTSFKSKGIFYLQVKVYILYLKTSCTL